jgi:hypothetical protein
MQKPKEKLILKLTCANPEKALSLKVIDIGTEGGLLGSAGLVAVPGSPQAKPERRIV